jgi:BirA family biotin operon repressor/biotin-[acetyl-CoA-carboxylase] ligase
MDEIERLARVGAPEGTAVIAGVQERGKGRAGRRWQTEPGTALLCSVLLRPELRVRDISSLPLYAGVAIAEAIEQITGLTTRLKWPNDIYVNDKKVCGILAQSRSRGERVEFVNLGFGVNVNAPATALPETATSLASETGSELALTDVERAVFTSLSARYGDFLVAGGRPTLDPWLQRALFLGEEVQIQQERRTIAGRFIGVDLDGSLRIETNEGELRVAIGELTRGPRMTAGAETAI